MSQVHRDVTTNKTSQRLTINKKNERRNVSMENKEEGERRERTQTVAHQRKKNFQMLRDQRRFVCLQKQESHFQQEEDGRGKRTESSRCSLKFCLDKIDNCYG